MKYRVELHKEGFTQHENPTEFVARRYYVTFDPKSDANDYWVDTYDLAGVQDGVAHYNFKERTVI